MNLFIDTETTGLMKDNLPLDDEEQPWPVELAGILTRPDGQTVSSFHVVIKPGGWVITQETAKIHGISHAYALEYGMPLEDALAILQVFADRAEQVLAYNMAFDGSIIEAACLRRNYASPLNGKQLKCVMRMAMEHFNAGRRSQKDVYRRLFNEEIPDVHSALGDGRACCRIFEAISPP